MPDFKSILPVVYSILGVTILFLTFKLKLERDSRKAKKNAEAYFARDLAASFARKKDIPEDFFITFDFDNLPVTNDSECKKCYEQVRYYSNLKLVHLKGHTNLELKEAYGMSHFESLTNYEKNYLTFMDILVKYGTILYEKDFIAEAKETLESALHYQCDISKCYMILSDIYLKLGSDKELENLEKVAKRNMNGSYYLNKVLHKIESTKKAID